jgi:hypothetical protein
MMTKIKRGINMSSKSNTGISGTPIKNENTNEPLPMSFEEGEEFIAQTDISGLDKDEIEHIYIFAGLWSIKNRKDGKNMPIIQLKEEGKDYAMKKWLPTQLLKKMILLNSEKPIKVGDKISILRSEKDIIFKRL